MDSPDENVVVTRKERPWWRAESAEDADTCTLAPKPGELCPSCGEGQLGYNGLFQLECAHCGAIADPGTFT